MREGGKDQRAGNTEQSEKNEPGSRQRRGFVDLAQCQLLGEKFRQRAADAEIENAEDADEAERKREEAPARGSEIGEEEWRRDDGDEHRTGAAKNVPKRAARGPSRNQQGRA